MKSLIEIKVRGYHEDHFMHVNNTRYLEFLEEGRWVYFEDHKLLANLFHPQGMFPAVVNTTINYRKSAVAGDILRIETEIKNTDKRKFIMSQKIYSKHSNEIIVDAEITNVYIGIKNRKPIEIKDDMMQLWAASSITHAASNA